MNGLIGSGLALRDQSNQALAQAAELETRRNEEEKLAKSAHRQQRASLTTTGAMLGASIGGALGGAQAGSMAGPWGAAIGAVAGLVLGEVF